MNTRRNVAKFLIRGVRFAAMLACVVVAAMSCGGSGDPKTPKGAEVYRAIDEKTVLTLRRNNEAELTEDGHNFVGTYTEEGPRIRVVVSIIGTTQAVYFQRVEEGLKPEGGGMLYNAKTYPEIMARVTAQRRQANLNAELLVASNTGSSERVTSLLNAGASANAEDSANNTPLRAAIRAGNHESVRALLLAGANVNHNAGQGTPLHLCIGIGGRRGWMEYVRERKPVDDAIMRTLIEHGADLNAVTDKGYSPLMFAVIRQHYPVIRYLVGLGVNRNLKTTDGKTAYSLADGNDDVLAALRTKEEEVAFQQKMSSYRSLLAGPYWRWDSSLSRYNADGRYEDVWDDGTRVSGTWFIESGMLTLTEAQRGGSQSSRIHQFEILHIDQDTCSLRDGRNTFAGKAILPETVEQRDREYRGLLARQWRWENSTTDYRPDSTFVEFGDSGNEASGTWRIETLRLYTETAGQGRNARSDKHEFFVESLSETECILTNGRDRFVGKSFGPAEMAALMDTFERRLPGKWQFRRYVHHFHPDGTYDEIYDRPSYVRSGTWTVTPGPRLVLRERTAGGRPVRSFDRTTQQQVNYEEKTFFMRDVSEVAIVLTDTFNRSVEGTRLGK